MVCVVILILVLSGIWVSRASSEYTSLYKQKVVKVFIQEYNEGLSYNPTGIVPESIYKSAKFDGYYDIYHSEDVIKGNIDNHEILMGEVHTQREEEHTDSDGNTTRSDVTVFHGMFGFVPINNRYNGEIKVHTDKGKLGRLFKNKTRVEMDSSEFEKYFDVYADDKIQAMQVLTSDIMEQMIGFRTNHKTKFDITVNRSHFFIRFHTGNMFEANIFRSSVNFDTLKKVYDIINFTFDITRSMIKVTEETQV